ncbi:MAG: hypothetical protein IPP17_04445 [Bacteroidetes bacterium]|nr:hypothetical protein [Bacteroidota bacterium]
MVPEKKAKKGIHPQKPFHCQNQEKFWIGGHRLSHALVFVDPLGHVYLLWHLQKPQEGLSLPIRRDRFLVFSRCRACTTNCFAVSEMTVVQRLNLLEKPVFEGAATILDDIRRAC